MDPRSPADVMAVELQRRLATAEKQRRILQIAATFLFAITRDLNINERTTRAKLRHNGEDLGTFTLREVLDMADAALEPDKPDAS